jgi:hypothetical protein
MTTQLPAGTRQDVVTYRVIDCTNTIKARGITSLDRAVELATKLAETPGVSPLHITKVTYVSFTDEKQVQEVS